MVVREKDEVNMTCEARGYPRPKVIWRREDGARMLVKGRGKLMMKKRTPHFIDIIVLSLFLFLRERKI